MESHSQALTPGAVRRTVAIICTVCVAGMIASAALKHLGGVITFGCLSTAGIVTLMAVIATRQEPTYAITSSMDPSRAMNVESLVNETIAEGASESTTRKLVGAAIELGRSFRRSV